jgi:AcrR family transcriptional regulator
MQEKGNVTRTAILDAAKSLFSEKGYSAVTMKDFCERCGLSRGGLYRHFPSTKNIFIALLNRDKDNMSAELEKAIADGVSARQMLQYFLYRQKQDVQNGAGRLSAAVYEFCIAETGQKTYLDNRFSAAVDTLAQLIRYGQAQRIFGSYDSESAARHIVICLEGLKLSAEVVSMTEAMLDEQLNVIEEMIVKEEK